MCQPLSSNYRAMSQLHQCVSLVLAVAAVAISSKCCCTATEYYVSAADGPPCPTNTTCHPLSFYVDQSDRYLTNDTVIYFLEGTHILDQPLNVSNTRNLTLMGLGPILTVQEAYYTRIQPTAVLRSRNTSSDEFMVIFENCESLYLSHISITQADMQTILFEQASDVALYYVHIEHVTDIYICLVKCYHSVLHIAP